MIEAYLHNIDELLSTSSVVSDVEAMRQSIRPVAKAVGTDEGLLALLRLAIRALEQALDELRRGWGSPITIPCATRYHLSGAIHE